MKEVHGGVLKAGEYRFDHAAPIAEVFARLRKGDVFTRTLVIPEGFNIFDIAGRRAGRRDWGPARRSLQAERQHTELVKLWQPDATSVEGYLFPDTYKFGTHVTPLQMLQVMVKRFREVSARLGLTGERRRTGPSRWRRWLKRKCTSTANGRWSQGVFENRMADNMPLQTDPAVVYASLLRGHVDRRDPSKRASLGLGVQHVHAHRVCRPGPICNPGLAALKAALQAGANGLSLLRRGCAGRDEVLTRPEGA